MGEVVVARGVDEIDLALLALGGRPRQGRHGQGQRLSSADRLGVDVQQRTAVVDPSQTLGAATLVEQRLRKGGLASPGMTDQDHIPDG